MDDLDSADTSEKCEVVYDVTNIEELDHFDIGDDSVMDIPSDQIDVMDYMEPTTIARNTRTRRTRRNSNRVVHILNSRNGPSTSAEDPMMEETSEVVMEPKQSLCRVFVTNDDPDHHTDGSPVFSRTPEPFSIAAQIIATEAASVDSTRVCTAVPQEFTGVGTFVVDVSDLANRSEVGLDGLGSWGTPQGTSKFYKVRGNVVVQGNPTDYAVKILCNRYTHPGTEERGMFMKKVYTGVTSGGAPCVHAVVVYEWDGEPHPVTTSDDPPHAAALKERPCGSRTWEGRLDNIFHDECLSYRGLPVFSRIAVDFETACRILLSAAQVQENRICTRVPQEFRECGTFVVDVGRCGGERTLCRDGRDWNKPSGSSRFFRFDADGNALRADVNNAHPGDRYDVQVMSKRYETLSPVGLYRKIYISRDRVSRRLACNLAVITYMFRPANSTTVTVFGGRPLSLPKKRAAYAQDGGGEAAPENGGGGRDRCEEPDDEYEIFELRRLALEKQAENQNRFGMLLDRAESFLDRFEQSGSQILVPLTRQLMQVWRGEEPTAEEVVETGEHHLETEGHHLETGDHHLETEGHHLEGEEEEALQNDLNTNYLI